MRKLPPYINVLFAGVMMAGIAGIAGCGGGAAVNDQVVVEEQAIHGTAGEAGTAEASATGLGGDVGTDAEGLEQSGQSDQSNDGDLLARRVIYFEYDSSIMSAEGEAVVQAHARYLNGVSNVRIILEGHADERGTREYNLALAEDRAKSVADVLAALGVGANRIQTVSYGEERPVALGHDDSAWGLNRRVEILYQ